MSDVPFRDVSRAARGPGAAGAAGAADAARPPAKQPGSAEGGAAFRALLEKLETRARELSDVREARDVAELSGAVETARHALEDALSLGDRLLEAYRAASARGDAPDVSSSEDAK